jgi:hypothetical protein
LSVAEIVEQSKSTYPSQELTKNQVYHHLPILIDAGIVIKYGTIETGKRKTDYYRRTAKAFSLHVFSNDNIQMKKLLKEKLGGLMKKLDPSRIEELSKLVYALEEMRNKYTREAYSIVGEDITSLSACSDFEWLVWILSLADEKLSSVAGKIRKIVFSVDSE